MQLELSHREAKDLFGAFVDDELGEGEERELRAHLDGCHECRTGWQSYERVVKGARGLDKLRAPPSLATLIARRVRRRRFGSRALHLTQAHYRLPAEIILPILLAAAVAAMLFFSAN